MGSYKFSKGRTVGNKNLVMPLTGPRTLCERTILRDKNICLSFGTHHDGSMIFKVACGNLIGIGALVLLWTCLVLMRLMQYMVDHGTLSTWCRVGCHIDLSFAKNYWSLWPSRSSVDWAWSVSSFSTNHLMCASQYKGTRALLLSGPNIITFCTILAQKQVVITIKTPWIGWVSWFLHIQISWNLGVRLNRIFSRSISVGILSVVWCGCRLDNN